MATEEVIVWVEPGGTEHIITAQPHVRVTRGLHGRGMPPIGYVEDEVPGQPGSRPRETRVAPRDVDVPMVFEGATKSAVRSQLRSFMRRFDPLQGDGKLKVTDYDGLTRELRCRYQAGMELDEGETTRGETWQKAILIFRAFDPFWYDTATQVQTWVLGSAGAFFPIFPLVLASSEVFAEAVVDNQGDVEAWPTWEITGPGSDIVLRNITTGRIISLPGFSLVAGETLSIDTAPFRKTVTKQDGSNQFGKLSSDSFLWQLVRGSNSIRVEMGGGTSASRVLLSHVRRYWSA